jgi:hypothetical protein
MERCPTQTQITVQTIDGRSGTCATVYTGGCTTFLGIAALLVAIGSLPSAAPTLLVFGLFFLRGFFRNPLFSYPLALYPDFSLPSLVAQSASNFFSASARFTERA